MSESIKKYLGAAAILALIAVGWSALRYSRAYSDSVSQSNQHTITVTGEGKVIGIPDIAQLQLSVITEGGTDMTTLQKTNTEKMNKIIDFVKSKGVAAKDVKTESYSVQPRYQYSTCRYSASSSEPSVCPPPAIVGYTIEQVLSVKVRNFNSLGDILSNAVTLGANSVSGPSFTIDDPAVLKNDARTEAFSKARASAQAMAKAGGFRLGKIVAVGENSYGYYDRGLGAGMMAKAVSSEMAVPAPAIEAGSSDITSNVSITYEIK